VSGDAPDHVTQMSVPSSAPIVSPGVKIWTQRTAVLDDTPAQVESKVLLEDQKC